MKGWKFNINVAPMVYQNPKIVWKPRPHLEETKQSVDFRKGIEEEISRLVSNAFACEVDLHMELYMPNKRVAYPTSVAHQVARCLVPSLIKDPRLIVSTSSRIHYNWNDDKNWKPRIEVTVTPQL